MLTISLNDTDLQKLKRMKLVYSKFEAFRLSTVGHTSIIDGYLRCGFTAEDFQTQILTTVLRELNLPGNRCGKVPRILKYAVNCPFRGKVVHTTAKAAVRDLCKQLYAIDLKQGKVKQKYFNVTGTEFYVSIYDVNHITNKFYQFVLADDTKTTIENKVSALTSIEVEERIAAIEAELELLKRHRKALLIAQL